MARTPPIPADIVELYVDESSQTKHRYLALGALAVRHVEASAIVDALTRARLPELPLGEMAWVKVSRTKLPAYKRIVDAFFDNPSAVNPLDFHMLTVDTHQLRDKAYNEGSREIGFNKEIYQLCQKCAKLYPTAIFHVYPDSRPTKSDPEELRLILNRGLRKRGDGRDWPFRRVHFRNSADTQLIQLADVLLGAIAFRLNGHDKAENASPAKCELAKHIFKRAGLWSPMADTAIAGKFTVWHRKLRKP